MKHYTVATCNPLRTTQSVNNVSLETTWTQISHLCSPFQHTFRQWVGNRALFPVQWSSPLMFRLWFMKSSVFHVQRSNHTQLCSLHPISFAQVKGTVCFFCWLCHGTSTKENGNKIPRFFSCIFRWNKCYYRLWVHESMTKTMQHFATIWDILSPDNWYWYHLQINLDMHVLTWRVDRHKCFSHQL